MLLSAFFCKLTMTCFLSHFPNIYIAVFAYVLEKLSHSPLSRQQDTEPGRTIDRSDKRGYSLHNFTPRFPTPSCVCVCALVTSVNSLRRTPERRVRHPSPLSALADTNFQLSSFHAAIISRSPPGFLYHRGHDPKN